MKKRLTAIILTIGILMLSLAGCGIITLNTERDLNQTAALVGYEKGTDGFVYRQKNSDGTYTDGKKVITKRDIVLAYNNYGYQYVQSYGYTKAQAIELMANQLVNNEIMVQQAIKFYGKDKIEDCLDEAEKARAEAEIYDTEYKAIYERFITIQKEQGLITDAPESTDGDDEDKTEARAVQSAVAENSKEYEAKYSKDMEVFEKDEDQKNWDSAVKRYEKNLNQYESGLTRVKYHNRMLDSKYESMLLEKYQKEIETQALKDWMGKDYDYLTDPSKVNAYIEKYLKPRYTEMYNQQKQLYQNDRAAYLTALEAYKGDSSFLLYSPIKASEGYFYVKNLLIGFDDELQAEYDELSSDDLSDAAKLVKRQEILNKVYAKDLRDLWTYETDDILDRKVPSPAEFPEWMKYTGEKIADTATWNDADYKYDLKEIENPDKVDPTNIKDTNANDFVTQIKNEMNALAASEAFKNSEYYDKSKTASENALATLIFKYGTDTGMFNNAIDYLVKPYQANVSETYVTEFSVASRNAYSLYMAAKAAGKSHEESQLASMQIVGSQYGWHVIMVTSVVDSNSNNERYADENGNVFDASVLTASTLNDDTSVTGWEKSFTYLFNKALQDEIIDGVYSSKTSQTIDTYKNKEGYVTMYTRVYADLK